MFDLLASCQVFFLRVFLFGCANMLVGEKTCSRLSCRLTHPLSVLSCIEAMIFSVTFWESIGVSEHVNQGTRLFISELQLMVVLIINDSFQD